MLPRSLPRPNFDGDCGGPSRRRRIFGAALGWSTCRLLPLPCCIVDAMNCLIRSASEAVGIFRKSGVRSRIQKLRDDIEADSGLLRYLDHITSNFLFASFFYSFSTSLLYIFCLTTDDDDASKFVSISMHFLYHHCFISAVIF